MRVSPLRPIAIQLRELLDDQGKELCRDPRACESWIRDICGDKTKEAHLLIQALKQQVPEDLIGLVPGSVVSLSTLRRFQQRLEGGIGLSADAARWAIRTWMLAMKLLKEADEVSLDELEADPHSFNGKKVLVRGRYMRLERALGGFILTHDNHAALVLYTQIPEAQKQRAVRAREARDKEVLVEGTVQYNGRLQIVAANVSGLPPAWWEGVAAFWLAFFWRVWKAAFVWGTKHRAVLSKMAVIVFATSVIILAVRGLLSRTTRKTPDRDPERIIEEPIFSEKPVRPGTSEMAKPILTISPEEACKLANSNRPVSVKMLAANVYIDRTTPGPRFAYVNSSRNHKDSQNLALLLTEAAVADYRGKGISNLKAYFLGKTIRVTGTVSLNKNNRPQIMVKDAAQITLLKPSD